MQSPQQQAIQDWLIQVGQAKPFLKWAGGKRPFLWSHADRLPEFKGDYFEPFLGSGAVFFHTMARQPRLTKAHLGDVNKHLVRCFLEIRDQPATVYEELTDLENAYSKHEDPAAFYYQQREIHNALSPRTNAARFIFLNRTCWNGLYRVNREGKFNVPYGRPRSTSIVPSHEEIFAASAALANSSIRCSKWQVTIATAKAGDFVFLDPPYFSELKKGTGTKYQALGFSEANHRELARGVADLASRGVEFMLTNSAEPEIIHIYEQLGLEVHRVVVKRSISSKLTSRGDAAEIIVTGPTRTSQVTNRLVRQT